MGHDNLKAHFSKFSTQSDAQQMDYFPAEMS